MQDTNIRKIKWFDSPNFVDRDLNIQSVLKITNENKMVYTLNYYRYNLKLYYLT